jgi:TolB-like protein
MFKFGDFELDFDRYELRRAGEVVKVEPRVLEVLNYLIEQRERVVSKAELHDTIWSDVHVSESAITTAVRDARRALSDSGSPPQWIRTVYGRGFHFVGDVTVVADTPAQPLPLPAQPRIEDGRRSIAVLPFTDLSAARDQAHFCDGMAEELINTLARLEELRVVSRAAAFDFGSDDDIRILGQKLGVDHVLRGSVRKNHEKLRITVHLVDTRSGHHVWSEKYDRQIGDIFALQEEIAEHTARVLLGVLSERNRKAIKSTPVRLDAYEFYLKGRRYLSDISEESLAAAIGMFEIALEFDPNYAPALAGLADALAELYALRGDEEARERAGDASERAVELAPQLAETHVSRGHVLTIQKRFQEAEAELRLALSISPGSPDARARLERLRVE